MFPSYPVPENDKVNIDNSFLSVISIKIAEVKEGLKLPSSEDTDRSLQSKIIEIGALIGAEAERRSGVDFEAYKTLRNEYIHAYKVILGTGILKDELLDETASYRGKAIFRLPGYLLQYELNSMKGRRRIKQIRKIFDEISTMLSASYVDVLSEIRPLGGKLNLHPQSHRLARKTFKQTVERIYPTDWIIASNNHEILPAIKVSLSGGVYQSGYDGTSQNDKGEIALTDGIEVPVSKIEETLAKLAEGGNPAWLQEPYIWEGDDEPVAEISFYARLSQGESGRDDDGNRIKPAGEDWFYGYIPDEDGNIPDEKEWYCHGYVAGSEKIGYSPTIKIALSNIGNERNMSAYHEFMHHMQDRLSDTLLRMEKAFSLYRTTKDGIRNPLVKEEDVPDLPSDRYVRDGNFADTYMGREYPFDFSLEILPTGAEAVFGGAYGGLMGLDDWNPDKEHRNFVLGIFATV